MSSLTALASSDWILRPAVRVLRLGLKPCCDLWVKSMSLRVCICINRFKISFSKILEAEQSLKDGKGKKIKLEDLWK